MALISFSVKVSAQSNGTYPYPGATHNYNVTKNGNNTYKWSILNENLTASSNVGIITESGNQVKIDWSSSLNPETKYFLKVEETAEGSECKNIKLFLVTIKASQFKLDIQANASSYCYDGPVEYTATGGVPSYDHGKATIKYTVKPTFNQGQWRFTYEDNATAEFTYTLKTVDNGNASGKTITVTDATNPVVLTFEVTNAKPETNTTDAVGDQAKFDSQISISACQTGPTWGISDTSNGNHSSSTTIDRPHTTTITPLD